MRHFFHLEITNIEWGTNKETQHYLKFTEIYHFSIISGRRFQIFHLHLALADGNKSWVIDENTQHFVFLRKTIFLLVFLSVIFHSGHGKKTTQREMVHN